jgi:hypothetical protein
LSGAIEQLPDQSAKTRRDARLRERLHEFAANHPDDPFVGIALPYLSTELGAGTSLVPTLPGKLGNQQLLGLYERVKARMVMRTPYYEAGDAVFACRSTNQARALRKPIAVLGIPHGIRNARPGWRALRSLGRQAQARGEELVQSIGRLPQGLSELDIAYGFLASAAMFCRAEAAVTARNPRVVVIGSVHGLAHRALAVVARDHGIPSVYIPHAPVLTNAHLVDLPVDYAALRGPEEVDHYAHFGVDPGLLDVVGDTSIGRALKPPDLDLDRPAVFAPSPDPPHQLTAVISLIASATTEPIVLSPHPRSDVRFLRSIVPDSWSVWEERTLELLQAGPPLLIQHSSGVALEALQLGIPVIELAFPGRAPSYPFIRQPYVCSVSNTDDLAAALLNARGARDSERVAMMEWSRRWVASVGPDAAAAAVALIDHARTAGPRPTPIWDAWSSRQ